MHVLKFALKKGFFAGLVLVFLGCNSTPKSPSTPDQSVEVQLPSSPFSNETSIEIDFNHFLKKDINKGAASADLCWLTDSYKKDPTQGKTTQQALRELGCGSLRFPYGHLADNYLWNTPPFNNKKRGLLPKVASPDQAPAGMGDWVNADGTFNEAMDFDEYMRLCQNLGAKPLVTVNVFSFKYKGGPSFETLKKTAVEWVKYAKNKNYHVAYWQIGNEVDHHKKLLTKDEYVTLYQEFAKAMKAEDPTIKIGPGILSDVSYYNGIVSKFPNLIDFTSCHQYMWPYIKTIPDYQAWKDNTDDYIPNVKKMQQAVSASSKPGMDIVITETGLSPVNKGMGSVNNTYKALWYFQLIMNEIAQPNVAYSYFWGVHSPWTRGDYADKNDLAVLLSADDNARKPLADVMKIFNENIQDNLVQTSEKSRYVRSYASIADSGKSVRIFVLNKAEKPHKVRLKLKGLTGQNKALQRMVFKGPSPESRKVSFGAGGKVQVVKDETVLTLPPLSITVLKN